jgi:hypothetical protein
VVAGLAVAAAALAFIGTTGSVFARRGHPLVVALNPADVTLATRVADAGSTALLSGKTAISGTTVASAARTALLSGPLNPVAIRALGIARFVSGDEQTGTRLVELASRFSKRDLVTQAWLFDHYLKQAKPDEAFRALDYAVRTHEEVKAVLFPRLAQVAVRSPEARKAIERHINAKTPWAAEFVSIALAEKGGAAMVAQLARDIGGLPNSRLFTNLQPEIVRHLLEDGAYQEARSYLVFYDPSSGRIVNQLDFGASNIRAGQSAFGWQVGQVPGTYAEFGPDGDGGTHFTIEVSDQQAGALLTKTLVLAPGHYTFSAPAGKDAPGHAWVEWTVDCVNAATPLARARPGESVDLAVSQNCPAQHVTLMMVHDLSSRAATYSANLAAPAIAPR